MCSTYDNMLFIQVLDKLSCVFSNISNQDYVPHLQLHYSNILGYIFELHTHNHFNMLKQSSTRKIMP